VPRSHALLAGLFDYAGLFPPASLTLDAVLANYAHYRSGRHGWMLGRLVVPAAQLAAVSSASRHLPTGDGVVPCRVSALGGPDPEADALQVRAFNRLHADAAHGAAVVDSIEVKTPTVAAVRAARAWAGRGFEVYCEVPLGVEMDDVLDAVAHAGLHAKVRTGGVTPESVPSFDDLAAFLCGCVTRGVVAKATAGLHHAVTGDHPLWSSADAPRTRMLGFLNVVLGAGIAEGAGRAAVQSAEVGATVAHLLSITGLPAWVGHDQVEWGGAHGPTIEGPLDQFAVSGRALIRSIGTCSFEEPVDGARRIGLIP
jgi:hypothetical protein